jgi:hypothetical protein
VEPVQFEINIKFKATFNVDKPADAQRIATDLAWEAGLAASQYVNNEPGMKAVQPIVTGAVPV